VTALQTQVGEIQSELAAAKAALDEALRSKGLLQNEVEEYRALLNTQLQAAMDKTTASATLGPYRPSWLASTLPIWPEA